MGAAAIAAPADELDGYDMVGVVHDPFAQDVVRSNHRASRRVVTSAPLGWRHVAASTWSERDEVDAFDMPISRSHLLVLVTGGRYVIESRHGATWQRALYGPGSIGLTAAGTTSTLRWRRTGAQALTSVHLYLDTALIDTAIDELSNLDPHAFPDTLDLDDPRVAAAAGDIAWALHVSAPALVADAAAHVLAARLVTTAAPTTTKRATAGLATPVLATVIEYMEAHLGAPITLDELGAVANLSKHHFLRQFKASTGVPPHRYLHRMRMEHAERLLVADRLTIRSVARACGYSSDRQFAAAFARHTGTTPLRYRAATRGR